MSNTNSLFFTGIRCGLLIYCRVIENFQYLCENYFPVSLEEDKMPFKKVSCLVWRFYRLCFGPFFCLFAIPMFPLLIKIQEDHTKVLFLLYQPKFDLFRSTCTFDTTIFKMPEIFLVHPVEMLDVQGKWQQSIHPLKWTELWRQCWQIGHKAGPLTQLYYFRYNWSFSWTTF